MRYFESEEFRPNSRERIYVFSKSTDTNLDHIFCEHITLEEAEIVFRNFFKELRDMGNADDRIAITHVAGNEYYGESSHFKVTFYRPETLDEFNTRPTRLETKKQKAEEAKKKRDEKKSSVKRLRRKLNSSFLLN
jgi:hypothetical protein